MSENQQYHRKSVHNGDSTLLGKDLAGHIVLTTEKVIRVNTYIPSMEKIIVELIENNNEVLGSLASDLFETSPVMNLSRQCG